MACGQQLPYLTASSTRVEKRSPARRQKDPKDNPLEKPTRQLQVVMCDGSSPAGRCDRRA